MLLNFCFLTVQEKQVMMSTLFQIWDLSTNRNLLFFLRKYYIPTSSKLRRFHWMYRTICRKQYLAELEKNFLQFRKFFVITKTFSKTKKYLVSTCIQISQELQWVLRLKYLYTSLQNLYILKQIIKSSMA